MVRRITAGALCLTKFVYHSAEATEPSLVIHFDTYSRFCLTHHKGVQYGT
jgi:hypothetical protein